MSKKFKIIAITDKKTVLINAGQRDGIKTEDKFDILDPTPRQLKDPDTGEILDTITQKKQRVFVRKVFEKYCVCVSEFQRTVLSPIFSLNNDLLNPSLRFMGAEKTETVGKPLNVKEDSISNLLNYYNYSEVKVGDQVQLVDQ